MKTLIKGVTVLFLLLGLISCNSQRDEDARIQAEKVAREQSLETMRRIARQAADSVASRRASEKQSQEDAAYHANGGFEY